MNYQVDAPIRNRTALVFDVETTGLLPQKPRYSTAPIPISAYPHIIQLSFVLYDIINKNIIRSYDSYVKIGNDVVISEFVSTFNASKVPEGFNYDSGNNSEWETVESLRMLIKEHVDANFK